MHRCCVISVGHDIFACRSRDRSSSRSRSKSPIARSSEKRSKIDSTQLAPVENGVIKAVVSESNGEISCSVEETNRIRALIGLKPLNNRVSKEAEAVKNFKDLQKYIYI